MTRTARQNASVLGHATVTVVCAHCSVEFAIPPGLEAVLHVNEETFYCPFGHSQYFPKGATAEQIAKARAEIAERNLANREEDLRSERASHAATKGHLTRARQREAAGVCPMCHRSFAQVRRHMDRMHPDFVEHHK
jgi:hypothetical protein